ERAPPEKRQKSPSRACELKSWLRATWLAPGIATLANTRTMSRTAPVKRILFLSSGRRTALASASSSFTGSSSPQILWSGAHESEPRGPGFGEHEAGHVVAQLDPGDVVESRVHATVDPAQAGLGRGGAISVEFPHHPRQHVRGDTDAVVITEEPGQHGRAGCADGAVGAWVGRVGRGRKEWGPGRVPGHGRGAVPAGANRRDRSPDEVLVLGVVEGDGGVGERQVEERKQLRCAGKVRVVGDRRVLGDLVPRHPDRTWPELGDDGLISGAGGAGLLTEVLDLVDGLGVGGRRDRRWRRGPELVRRLENEWGHPRPLGEH